MNIGYKEMRLIHKIMRSIYKIIKVRYKIMKSIYIYINETTHFKIIRFMYKVMKFSLYMYITPSINETTFVPDITLLMTHFRVKLYHVIYRISYD